MQDDFHVRHTLSGFVAHIALFVHQSDKIEMATVSIHWRGFRVRLSIYRSMADGGVLANIFVKTFIIIAVPFNAQIAHFTFNKGMHLFSFNTHPWQKSFVVFALKCPHQPRPTACFSSHFSVQELVWICNFLFGIDLNCIFP